MTTRLVGAGAIPPLAEARLVVSETALRLTEPQRERPTDTPRRAPPSFRQHDPALHALDPTQREAGLQGEGISLEEEPRFGREFGFFELHQKGQRAPEVLRRHPTRIHPARGGAG